MPSSPSSSSPRRIDFIYHPALVWLCRLLVGGTFVLSGFVKSIDPWGSFYKIAEYIDVWGLDIPSSFEVLGAFALGGFEFVAGFLVMFGCYRRAGVWLLLLMMAFLLPLTLYIVVADPVADCGCFGDFIILSNTATFVKNIVLTLLLVYLALFNTRVGGLFVPYI
ncbi:MAG: DoxX family membrane protein, partial [Duncaniella sp.]|nr:DoxX family membrane protein [Duncaniella sp.]